MLLYVDEGIEVANAKTQTTRSVDVCRFSAGSSGLPNQFVVGMFYFAVDVCIALNSILNWFFLLLAYYWLPLWELLWYAVINDNCMMQSWYVHFALMTVSSSRSLLCIFEVLSVWCVWNTTFGHFILTKACHEQYCSGRGGLHCLWSVSCNG